MKYVIRVITLLFLIAGCIGIGYYTNSSLELAADVSRLEAELGRMTISDPTRIYLTEIKTPNVPPEVALKLKGIWQFRCYLPAGYDFISMNGSGNISDEGLYHDGGYSSNWGMSQSDAVHELLTLSIQQTGDQLTVFYSLGGSSGTTSWNELESMNVNELMIKRLVKSEQGPRSFDKDSILPLLKIYDSNSAQEIRVGGKMVRAFKGGLFVICPKSRDNHFQQLRRGITPPDFDPSWLAKELTNE